MKLFFEIVEEINDPDVGLMHVPHDQVVMATGVRSDFLTGSDNKTIRSVHPAKGDESIYTGTFDTNYVGRRICERIHYCDHDEPLEKRRGCVVLETRPFTTI